MRPFLYGVYYISLASIVLSGCQQRLGGASRPLPSAMSTEAAVEVSEDMALRNRRGHRRHQDKRRNKGDMRRHRKTGNSYPSDEEHLSEHAPSMYVALEGSKIHGDHSFSSTQSSDSSEDETNERDKSSKRPRGRRTQHRATERKRRVERTQLVSQSRIPNLHKFEVPPAPPLPSDLLEPRPSRFPISPDQLLNGRGKLKPIMTENKPTGLEPIGEGQYIGQNA
jgi:hypothetical protein